MKISSMKSDKNLMKSVRHFNIQIQQLTIISVKTVKTCSQLLFKQEFNEIPKSFGKLKPIFGKLKFEIVVSIETFMCTKVVKLLPSDEISIRRSLQE